MGRVSALICLCATVENQDLRAKVDQRSVAERKDHGRCVGKGWGVGGWGRAGGRSLGGGV